MRGRHTLGRGGGRGRGRGGRTAARPVAHPTPSVHACELQEESCQVVEVQDPACNVDDQVKSEQQNSDDV